MREEVKNIIVIGASAGGISAMSRLAATFTTELDAAIFVVIHISRISKPDVIVNFIQKDTVLDCKLADDGEMIENNTIYFCRADHHMILEKGKIHIKKGAKENHYRPAIDVLFRSAAVAYGNCTVGIILTGLLDDGTSGMLAIKRSDGICIVQAPEEAEFSDMPLNVMRNVEVDYSASIDEVIYILLDIFFSRQCLPNFVSEEVRLEAQIAMRMSSSVDDLLRLGTLTAFTCPDCGGTLAQIVEGDMVRFRCYTGHAFTDKSLEIEQAEKSEESLWVAIRLMEERKNLLSSLSEEDSRVQQLGLHIERLKKMMIEIGKIDKPL